MEAENYLNVFKGKDSLRKFYNPDCAPPLPLVEIPQKLNPFYSDNVRIYAKLLTALPAQNVKALPGTPHKLYPHPHPHRAPWPYTGRNG